MTDNEIIKALKCCQGNADCANCPYYENNHHQCGDNFNKDVLDLINRQQAEIERLRNILLRFMDEVAKWENEKGVDVSELPLIPICDEGRACIDRFRARAIKEFAERLKKLSGYSVMVDGDREIPGTRHYSISEISLDNLVKEMVGDVE